MRYQGDHEALDRIAARLVELESALETQNQARAMPPVNPDDERVIDDLMAKRAKGLKTTPMRPAEAWVPVGERMPKQLQEVLVWWAQGAEYDIAEYQDGEFHCIATRYPWTHWMPLPTPPVTDAEPFANE